MKDLKREITVMAGIIAIAVALVTVLGINKISRNFSVAAETEEEEQEEKFEFVSKTEEIKAGSKYQFSVTGKSDDEVIWSVSDKKYAVVNQKGVLLGKRAGNVTVYASNAGRIISYDVDIQGKYKVAIDAGHQLRGDSSTEPEGPGSKTRKAKVAGGATGAATGVPEYQLTLDIAKKLRKELLDRGYEVYMVRTKNNVNIIFIDCMVTVPHHHQLKVQVLFIHLSQTHMLAALAKSP